jgi:dienelactone hydrolase
VPIPAPTGPHPVGTSTWHWVDGDRLDTVTPDPSDVREVMAQGWYPTFAAAKAKFAPYAALNPNLAHISSHSLPDSLPITAEAGLPVVVICPGRGVGRHSYTSLAEDLASHGYFVLAIDSPHSGRVRYPSGRHLPPSARYKIPFETLIGPYEKVDAFFEEAARFGAGDVAFAVGELERLNRADPAHRLTGKLDLSQLAVFGHSLGGRIAGAAVAMDSRFVAYAAMEGVPPRAPRNGGLDAAALQLVSSALPEMALPNIRELVPNRRNDVFIATLEGFGHNSATDLPLLYPEEYSYEIDPLLALQTCRKLVRRFFDEYLRRYQAVGGGLADGIAHVRLEEFQKPGDFK